MRAHTILNWTWNMETNNPLKPFSWTSATDIESRSRGAIHSIMLEVQDRDEHLIGLLMKMFVDLNSSLENQGMEKLENMVMSMINKKKRYRFGFVLSVLYLAKKGPFKNIPHWSKCSLIFITLCIQHSSSK